MGAWADSAQVLKILMTQGDKEDSFFAMAALRQGSASWTKSQESELYECVGVHRPQEPDTTAVKGKLGRGGAVSWPGE